MSGIYEYLAGMLPGLALCCLSHASFIVWSLVCLFSSHEAVTRGRLESHKSHSTRGRGGEFEKVNAKQMHLHKF